MTLPRILNEDDYQTCIRQAKLVNNVDKNNYCSNFQYVFYAELEINLNWNFNDVLERWCLYFTDISLPPEWNNNKININDSNSIQILIYPPNTLIIYHNAKIKYRCLICLNEWTSARGRIIFQTEIPQINKYNFLFVNLCTQQCRLCRQEIQPSWYLNEITRVMKNVCKILIEKFYSHRNFILPRLISSEEDISEQRISYTKGHHEQNLCQACREGYCFDIKKKKFI